MSIVLQGILWLVLLIVMVPVSVLLLQAICAWLPPGNASFPPVARPSLAILIPAHDESAGIGRTLASVLPQLQPGDRVVVVADNCTDGTAELAAAAGVEVIQRNDETRRGKGYALDFGVRHLQIDPPAMVMILDADCTLAAGSVEALATVTSATRRPAQALDLMRAGPGAGIRLQTAEFAWIVKNQVRPLGFLSLGLPCQLMGTGMMLPWELLRTLPLATGHLVEDMQMGIDCARAGRSPMFCPDAVVLSEFPVTRAGVQSQRARWEHGHLAMIVGQVPRLVVEGLKGKGSGLLALALDMCVPPLALLAIIVVALVGLSTAFALATGLHAPLAIAAGLLLMVGAAVGLSWLRFGRDSLSFGRLILAPAYVLAKLPLYVRFLVRRQAEWVRSRRDGS